MSAVPAELRELQRWCRDQTSLEVPDTALAQLANYLELLRLWSKRAALIGPAEEAVLIGKHLADSLFAAAACPAAGRAADLGSGAGLPGIPIAIARPNLQIDLVESRAKKASFLADATRHLANARVATTRIEDLAGADYDVVVARALAPLERLLPLAGPLLRPHGTLLALKARSFEAELAAADPQAAGLTLEESNEYQLPTGERRVLLRFQARQRASCR